MRKILAIVLAAIMILSLCACGSNETEESYQKAESLLFDGQFLEAYKLYNGSTLANYKDSSEKAKVCQYLYATEMLYADKYEEALEYYSKVVGFEDSSDKMSEVVSHAAKRYLNNQLSGENFDLILKKYDELSDISKNIVDIFYLRSYNLYSMQKYDEAFEYARFITDYEDADKLADDTRYMSAVTLANNGDLCGALTKFYVAASQEEQYRNCVEHAIGIRREILCTPFYGKVSVDNGSGKTYMLFTKNNDFAKGFVAAFNSNTGDLLVNWNFTALFAYDGILLAKDDNALNIKTCKETITQTGLGKDAVYTIRFNEGPLNDMSFESDVTDGENPVYTINESPEFTANQELIDKINQKYMNYDTIVNLPESVGQIYKFEITEN